MTVVVILNVVLSAVVVIGMLGLLGWAIVSDRGERRLVRVRRRRALRRRATASWSAGRAVGLCARPIDGESLRPLRS